MQLLLIRHALPQHSAPGDGADPGLTPLGIEQAARIAPAVARFDIARIVSSTQIRAVQTAESLASPLKTAIDVDERLCEYDRDFAEYMTIEAARTAYPDMFAMLKEGHLPPQVDEPAFRERVLAGIADITASSTHTDTVAIFAHGGVINMVLQDVLGSRKALGFPIDYCSITRVLFSRSGARSVASVNETQHVWDLLPRNR